MQDEEKRLEYLDNIKIIESENISSSNNNIQQESLNKINNQKLNISKG